MVEMPKEQRVRPIEHRFNPGNLPRQFRCVCGMVVVEENAGQGFKNCGELTNGRDHYPLCEKCYKATADFINGLEGSGG